MAAEGEAPKEIKAHAKSYSLFVSLIKWGAILSAVVTFFVVLMIAA